MVHMPTTDTSPRWDNQHATTATLTEDWIPLGRSNRSLSIAGHPGNPITRTGLRELSVDIDQKSARRMEHSVDQLAVRE